MRVSMEEGMEMLDATAAPVVDESPHSDFSPGDAAIAILTGLETIEHLIRTMNSADARSHITSLIDLLKPVGCELCSYDLVPAFTEL